LEEKLMADLTRLIARSWTPPDESLPTLSSRTKPTKLTRPVKKYSEDQSRDDHGRFSESDEPKVYATKDDIKENKSWGETYNTWIGRAGQGEGSVVKGIPLSKDEAVVKYPELYHVTSHGDDIQQSGLLQAGSSDNKGGLGSSGQAKAVSFTTNINDARDIQRDIQQMTELAHNPDFSTIEKFAREDELRSGLSAGALNGALDNARRNYEVNMSVGKDTPEHRDSVLKDSYNTYLWGRDSAGGGQNTIIFGSLKDFRGTTPEKIQILAIPSLNIPDKALIRDRVSRDFLHELQVDADVPVKGLTIRKIVPSRVKLVAIRKIKISDRARKVAIAKAHKIKIDPDYKHPQLSDAQTKLQDTVSSAFAKQKGRILSIIRKHIDRLKPLRVKKTRKIFKADEPSMQASVVQRLLNLAGDRYNALPSPLQDGLVSQATSQTPLTDDQLLELLTQAEDNADALRETLAEVGETEEDAIISESGVQEVKDAQDALESATSVGADKGITELNITDNDVIASADQASQQFAQDRAAEMVGKKWVDGELVDNPNAKWVISDTTRSDINRIITDAFSEPTSIQDVTQAIQDAGTFSEERAANIARTEIGNAQVQSNFLAWQEAGNIAKLNFLTTNEVDVCEVCLDFEDDNPYDFSEAPIPIEDTHPSCRCILVPVFSDGQEEEE
jgi:hypothetical protein